MAAGDLINGDWQMEWAGLRFGGPGDPIQIVSVSGLADLPGVSTADRDQVRAHGRIPGDDFLGERVVVVSVRVEGDSLQSTFDAVAELANTCVPGSPEAPLVFRIPVVAGGRDALVSARLRNKSLPVTSGAVEVGIVSGDLQFVATDPRIFDAVDTVQSTALASGGGGLTWPAQWAAVWGAIAESGTLEVANAGNFDSPWSARIDGPCDRPSIINVSTGQSLTFDLSLAAGEWLDIDVGRVMSVLLNGSESRLHTLIRGSRSWLIEPGTTELLFQASTPSAASLTVTSRSAWTS